ncbi:proline-rich receptor-like protein kinase PERK2 [Iris pallida]|uniref:Proline-rich receptor-like protein kinase PERK2 n=1 Tax=Iris pallida TaxID=29817 RepID=A0AAX6ER59_IRIPA|nr:proline-rich receptor-like protein kinase PERK2 [Iris pallida]
MWRRPRMVVDGIGDSYSRYGTARSGGCGRRRRSDRGSGRENVDLDLEHQWAAVADGRRRGRKEVREERWSRVRACPMYCPCQLVDTDT